jgi:hypothetical protein
MPEAKLPSLVSSVMLPSLLKLIPTCYVLTGWTNSAYYSRQTVRMFLATVKARLMTSLGRSYPNAIADIP